MNHAPPRWSLWLKAKYKSDLHEVQDLIEARLETNMEPSSELTQGEPSDANDISSSTPSLNPPTMDDRREDDGNN